MIVRLMLAALVLVGCAMPAEARRLDVTRAQFIDHIGAFYKRGDHVALDRPSKAQWAWSLASVGTARDLKLERGKILGGEAWILRYQAGGKDQRVTFAKPGLDALRKVEAMFVRRDLQAIVVFCTEGDRPTFHVITYQVQRDARGNAQFVVKH